MVIQILAVTKIARKLFTDHRKSNLGMTFIPQSDVLVSGWVHKIKSTDGFCDIAVPYNVSHIIYKADRALTNPANHLSL